MTIEFTFVPHGSEAWKQAVRLRENVLRKPLGSIFSSTELEEEKNHIHIVGYLANEIIATAVLVPENSAYKMQRVAVKPELRNLNIGSKMMRFCELFAVENGYTTIYCHARDSAANFYLKNGYVGVGDYFDEDGIPHLKMEKSSF